MKIFGMGGIELVIILVVILLIFGPKNLPKLGNAFGKTIKGLRAGMNEGKAKEEPAADAETEASEAAAELEAEVAEDVVGAEEQVADEDSGIAEAAEEAVAEASAAVDEAFDEAPKKVKRVVRKKVVSEPTDEAVE